MDKMDWTKTKAVWDGEDWRFTEVPLEACLGGAVVVHCWDGRTCFSPMELNYNGDDPVKAVDALMYWCEHGESQPDEVIKQQPRRYEMKKNFVFYKLRLEDLVKASIAPLRKQVQDNEALFDHMVANSNWLVLDVDAAKLRNSLSGSDEAPEVRSLVNYIRLVKKRTAFTRRIGGSQWYVEINNNQGESKC